MISQGELLEALKGLSVDQLQGILAQGHGRSPQRPRQLHDLRLPPTAQDPRPTFYSVEAPRDQVITFSPFPRLMWHATTGQEITVYSEDEFMAKKGAYHALPPDMGPTDPEARLRAEFEALSPEDQEAVIRFQQEAKQARLRAMFGDAKAPQFALPEAEKRGPGRPKKEQPA